MSFIISLRRSLVNHTGSIFISKVIQYLGAALFAVLVPRIMGPEKYGEFAAFISLLFVLSTFGDMGTLLIYGNFVPLLNTKSDNKEVKWLFSKFIILKSIGAVWIGVVLLLTGKYALPNVSNDWLFIGCLILFFRITADNFFHLAYGLNFMFRWLARESLRSIIQLLFIAPLFLVAELPGAVIGLLITDIFFFFLGISWSYKYWDFQVLNLSKIKPYLNYGLIFFLSTVFMTAFNRGGTVLLSYWQINPTKIAYYNIALTILFVLHSTLKQFMLSVIPILSRWLKTDRETETVIAINAAWKITTIISIIGIIAIWMFSEYFVPLLFGDAYLPVVPLIKCIALNLIPLSFGNISFLIAAIYQQPQIPLIASFFMLVVFLVISSIFTPITGVQGPVIGSLIATPIFALVTFIMCRQYIKFFSLKQELAIIRSPRQ